MVKVGVAGLGTKGERIADGSAKLVRFLASETLSVVNALAEAAAQQPKETGRR